MKKLIGNTLEGNIKIPESKTHIHRILFASLLKRSLSFLKISKGCYLCDDIKATVNVLQRIGCKFTYNELENVLSIDSTNIFYNGDVINCNACATTLRISVILLLHLFGEAKLTGVSTLMSRPLTFYKNLFEKFNIKFSLKNEILEVKGNLNNIFNSNFLEVENVESSQYITALMFVIPFYTKKFELVFKSNMESVSYLEITKDILKKYNIFYEFEYENKELTVLKAELNLTRLNKIIYIKKDENLYFNNEEVVPEVDYGLAAFWLVANRLGNNITINGNSLKNDKFLHPDQEILNILDRSEHIIDISNCPDLLPILLVFASFRKEYEYMKIINFQRNRLKESNRVENMINQLNQLNGNIILKEEEIIVYNVEKLISGCVDSYNDHRIAMAFAVAASKVDGELIILNDEAVKKSYYNFWNDFKSLGGNYE